MAASVDGRLHSNAYGKIKHQESQQQQQQQQQYIANGHGCVYVESSEEEWESEAEEDSDEWLSSLLPKENAVAADGDPRDAGTADEWVKRHPQMIRLTGRHPFNSEPPLCKLMQSGFLTPVSLHYVRNHGYVPRLQWDTWTVEVCGLVRRPMRLTMDQLCSEFRPRELPVTLVCAGNRRKEQNLVKQTIGFNWGAAGVSTSMWRGARLCDVLRRCGIMSKKKGVKYVCFEGAENLPGGGGSRYGTSISVDIAMDRSRDLILAYRQNGEPLHPDHGFPVRMIIPGFIGGRMVKWLGRIIVSGDESDSHYHYHDNRVLPSHVDAETAKAEDWWHRPEYIINELNINSVITTPSHEEILPINSATSQRPYTLRGYAYSGGGRKIIRVEITLDGGETWKLCRVNHVEKPTKYGKYWCWCFWEQDVEVMELLGTKEVAVRAWDESMNTQPKDLTWNVMGMMNNCWFRVKMQVCKPHQGEIGLVFEHPTRPGNQSGGWMVRDKRNESLEQQNAGLLKKSSSVPVMNTATRQITMAEVKKHSTPESAWIVVGHHVYDCTRFLKDHPGGSDSILINAGSDCTEEFDAIHSDKAKALLEDFRIGELVSASTGYSSSSCDTSPENSVHGSSRALSALLHSSTLDPINEVAVSRPQVALSNPKQKIRCTLVDKIPTSHDTRIFRFRLPSPDQVLGLPIGKHIFLCANIRGKLCLRAYTPVSCDDDDVGHFSLLIKVYFKNTHPKFPEGGLMTQYLESLPLGQTVDVKGPLGHIQYTDHGSFTINGEPRRSRKVAMLAGGTGITPLYQIIRAIMRNPDDRTEMFLIYANRTEADILLRAELDAWAADDPARLHVWYVVEQAAPNWKYDTGFIREEIMRSHLPSGGPPAHEAIALMCGPPPMIQFACLPNLAKLGYDKDADCFQF